MELELLARTEASSEKKTKNECIRAIVAKEGDKDNE